VKEYLAGLVRPVPNSVEARNLAREYLQALILQSLQREGAMTALAFHGGTALRFLFSLPRFSEDLDFALEGNPTTSVPICNRFVKTWRHRAIRSHSK
jgi:predicted nucleotidyltransferase component of viral defense system